MIATATPVRLWQIAVPLIAALAGLVAALDPRLAVLLSIGVAGGVLTLVDPRAGVCIFAFSSVLLDGVEAGIAADKLVVGAIALSWLASVALRGHLRDEIVTHAPFYLVVTLLLGAWYVASCTWAEDTGEATYQLVRLAPNLLLIPIIVSAVDSARTLRWIIGSLMAGVLVSVIYGALFGALTGDSEGRLAGFALDANSLALWSIMSAALAYGIIASGIARELRLLTIAVIAVLGIVVMGTGSRTGLIDMGVTLLLAPLVLRPGHRLLAVCITVVAVTGVTVYVTSFADPEVKQHIKEGNEGASGRTSLWAIGVRMIKANPVGGVGGGNFITSSAHYLLQSPGEITDVRYIVDDPKAAHNTYIQVTAETGFVGGGLFVSLLGLSALYAFRAMRRFRRAGLRDHEVLARGLLLAYAGVAVCMLSISIDTAKPTWLVLALGPAILKLSRISGTGAGTPR